MNTECDTDEDVIGKRDEHTGARYDSRGNVWTFEHVADDDVVPVPVFYAVTLQIQFTERPVHENTHFVPHDQLGEFLKDHGSFGEYLVGVEPVDVDEIDAHVAWFTGDSDERPDSQ